MYLGKLLIQWGKTAEESREDHLNNVFSTLSDDCGNGVGKTTHAVQDLIFSYYNDVHAQATSSFRSAQALALFGFLLLVSTVGYVIWMDYLRHFPPPGFVASNEGMTVGAIGLISGVVVEFLAGTQLFM